MFLWDCTRIYKQCKTYDIIDCYALSAAHSNLPWKIHHYAMKAVSSHIPSQLCVRCLSYPNMEIKDKSNTWKDFISHINGVLYLVGLLFNTTQITVVYVHITYIESLLEFVTIKFQNIEFQGTYQWRNKACELIATKTQGSGFREWTWKCLDRVRPNDIKWFRLLMDSGTIPKKPV